MLTIRHLIIGFLAGCTSSSQKSSPTQHNDYSLYTRVHIEVDRAGDIQPHESILTQVSNNLATLLNKDVEIELDDIIDSAEEDYQWTMEELDSLHEQYFLSETDPQVLRLHSMILDGSFELSEGNETSYQKLGHAWGSNRVAMFKQTLLELCNSLNVQSAAQRTALCRLASAEVWTHELGHLLGLVDNGVPMVEDHKDPDHGNHDIDPNCVMYWMTEKTILLQRLEERQQNEEQGTWFCSKCQQDMQALQQ